MCRLLARPGRLPLSCSRHCPYQLGSTGVSSPPPAISCLPPFAVPTNMHCHCLSSSCHRHMSERERRVLDPEGSHSHGWFYTTVIT